MTPTKSLILEHLQSGAYIKKRELVPLLNKRVDKLVREREVRLAIEQLIKEGEMIIASEKGYKLITTFEEKEEAIKYLKAKAEAISVRANYLEKNWNYRKMKEVKQIDLFV